MKSALFRNVFIAANLFFAAYTIYLTQHLMDNHNAGHHITYFVLLPVFCLVWWMQASIKTQTAIEKNNDWWKRELETELLKQKLSILHNSDDTKP